MELVATFMGWIEEARDSESPSTMRLTPDSVVEGERQSPPTIADSPRARGAMKAPALEYASQETLPQESTEMEDGE